ncbi:E3 ubiquitin-protein ligase RSL1-like [Pyrus communis]|uniref:E3 ubiquitin-protein ligase RSL1-like n=1 Tax=Pyrus communis TaxID=23211 RepID=UPI0035C22CA7
MENPLSSHSHIPNFDMEDDAFSFTPTSRNPSTIPINVDDDDDGDGDGDLRSITASLLKSAPKPTEASNFIDLSEETLDFYDGDDELRILRFKPSNTPFGKRRKKTFSDFSVTESGQSSNSKSVPDFVCEICVDHKSGIELFRIENCSHGYCTDCMVKYVVSKLQENITSIRCPVPDCIGLLEPEYCRPILPREVFDRWGTAMCEAVILGSEKFYCPYKDCSAMLIDDGSEVVRQSECPNCWRMFCAHCKVPWHEGIDCEEFVRLNKEDIMLMNLAKEKQWPRCPNCRFFVEKSVGCMFMMCRCRTAFCYNCGDLMSNNHAHNCRRSNRS